LAGKAQIFSVWLVPKAGLLFAKDYRTIHFQSGFKDFQDRKRLRPRILGLKDETELTAFISELSALGLIGFLYNIKTFQSLNIATICVNSQHGKNFN